MSHTLATAAWVFIVIAIAVRIIRNVRSRKILTHICKNCLSRIRPEAKLGGNPALEVLAWCFFLIPGVIYSFWRRQTAKTFICPVCKNENPVPLNTPEGKRLSTETV
jgi:hypothetical protein